MYDVLHCEVLGIYDCIALFDMAKVFGRVLIYMIYLIA